MYVFLKRFIVYLREVCIQTACPHTSLFVFLPSLLFDECADVCLASQSPLNATLSRFGCPLLKINCCLCIAATPCLFSLSVCASGVCACVRVLCILCVGLRTSVVVQTASTNQDLDLIKTREHRD